MCIKHTNKKCCKNSAQRKNEYEKCSPEQIKKCHGYEKKHSCYGDNKKGFVK